MAGSDSVEKLEDVIVRSAEQISGNIRAAREAISTVIFGQQRVVENALVTILSGGHALLAENHGRDRFAGGANVARDLFGGTNDHVLEFLDAVLAGHMVAPCMRAPTRAQFCG